MEPFFSIHVAIRRQTIRAKYLCAQTYSNWFKVQKRKIRLGILVNSYRLPQATLIEHYACNLASESTTRVVNFYNIR